MGENTKIEWCDHTFNPWIGCTKVSEACRHCYAEHSTRARVLRSRGQETWGKGAPRVKTGEDNWKKPLKWNREAGAARHEVEWSSDTPPVLPHRPRVFCASLADWLDDEVPVEWLADLLDLIARTPNLDWLLLTKRPELWLTRMQAVALHEAKVGRPLTEMLWAWLEGNPPDNVWIGTTVESQRWADERIPHLLKIPAKVRFLSCEPLLGPVDLTEIIRKMLQGEHVFDCLRCDVSPEDDEWHGATIHWVICGGESGPGARPMHPDWARGLRDQCLEAGVKFFFKQWGEWLPDNQNPKISVPSGATQSTKVGKKAAGRLLDGKEWSEFPAFGSHKSDAAQVVPTEEGGEVQPS